MSIAQRVPWRLAPAGPPVNARPDGHRAPRPEQPVRPLPCVPRHWEPQRAFGDPDDLQLGGRAARFERCACAIRDSVTDSLRRDRCRVGDVLTSPDARAGVVAPAAVSSWPVVTRPLVATPVHNPAADPSGSFRFAAAVAECGLLLRDSEYKGDADYDFVYERAREALGNDEDGRRSELLSLIRTADSLASVPVAVHALEPE